MYVYEGVLSDCEKGVFALNANMCACMVQTCNKRTCHSFVQLHMHTSIWLQMHASLKVPVYTSISLVPNGYEDFVLKWLLLVILLPTVHRIFFNSIPRKWIKVETKRC